MNRAEEDYIKVIYELIIEKQETLVKTNDLVERFGYTDQSVNEMIKKLESKQLVVFYPYKGLELTKKGREVAIRMVRAHRIWEVFLTEKLGFSWEHVHEDAEMLEHASSELVLRRLYDYLGKPAFCQHGNPIPDFDGNMKETFTLSLSEVEQNASFRLKRVLDSKALLVYLDTQGIKLDQVFKVLKHDAFNGVMTILSNQQTHVISIKTAKMLFGELLET